jgi:hypothetical protein
MRLIAITSLLLASYRAAAYPIGNPTMNELVMRTPTIDGMEHLAIGKPLSRHEGLAASSVGARTVGYGDVAWARSENVPKDVPKVDRDLSTQEQDRQRDLSHSTTPLDQMNGMRRASGKEDRSVVLSRRDSKANRRNMDGLGFMNEAFSI